MNTYTIKELSYFENTLNNSDTISEFIERCHINEIKFKDLLQELFETKIMTETKLRKKRIKKFIDYYCNNPNHERNVAAVIEYIKENSDAVDAAGNDNLSKIIREIYSTKKITIDDDTVEFYKKDLDEFFNLFMPNITLAEILRTYK